VVRRKLVIGVLLAAGSVLGPATSAGSGAELALDCGPLAGVGPLGTACPLANTAIAAVCYGSLPSEIPTLGPITVDLHGAPSVQCPI
jgi:hypothetical protein